MATKITTNSLADGAVTTAKLAASGLVLNGLTLTSLSSGFTLAGGTTSKILTFPNTLTFSGVDGSALNIGTGGTLGTAAYTPATNYLPVAGGTLTGTLLFSDNTLDIGATGAARPRSLFLGTSLAVQAVTNQVVVGSGANLSTVNFPASSGSVTLTMPNVTSILAYSTSALTTGRIPFNTTNGVLTDAATLTWASSTLGVTGDINNTGNQYSSLNSLALLTSIF